MITIVVAVAANNVIGRDGKIPWPRCAIDRDRLHRIWENRPVLLGRKTYESMPASARPTLTYVLSRTLEHPDAPRFENLKAMCRYLEWQHRLTHKEVVVAGGAEVYAQTLPFADRILMTRLRKSYEGDAYFPGLHFEEWEVVSEEHHPDFIFKEHRRKT